MSWFADWLLGPKYPLPRGSISCSTTKAEVSHGSAMDDKEDIDD